MCVCVCVCVCCYMYPTTFDDLDKRPIVLQMWVEVMASASDLGSLQHSRAAQRLAGIDHVIWVTAPEHEKLRVSKDRLPRSRCLQTSVMFALKIRCPSEKNLRS